MKVFVAGLAHESNQMSSVPTNRASFEQDGITRGGAEALDRDPFLRGMNISDLVRRHSLECTFGLFTYAQPSGPIVRRDYESLRDELLDKLRSAQSPDIVFLFLHGAMMAEGYNDCEGDLLNKIRAIVGPDVPVGAVFDLHGNVTQQMVDSGAILVGCKEYPHIDFDQRACQLFQILMDAARKTIEPVTAFQKIPMVGFFPTSPEPMRSFVDEVSAVERTDDILSVTLCHGFPWANWHGASAGVLVVADGNLAKAKSISETIADKFFKLHPKVNAKPMLSAADAVQTAMKSSNRPVIIADASDNAGGGGASDSTFLLAELLAHNAKNVAVGLVCDPLATDIAHKLGEGARWRLRIGGKAGPFSGQPVDLDVEILACRSGIVQRGFNAKLPLQRTACVEANGIYIVLSEQRCQTFDTTCFTEHGIDVSDLDIVVVKSSQHFLDQFAPYAGDVLYADTGGALSFNFRESNLSGLRRPIFPIDEAPLHEYGKRWDA